MSMPDQAHPFVQELTREDISEILRLVEALNWTHVEADLEVMLRVGLFLGLRDDRGEIIATGALFPYGETLASVGMIMVNPNHRRKGYGKAIMLALHRSDVARGRHLCLVATDEGEPLYRKLGYHTASRIRKFFADPKEVREKTQSLRFPEFKLRTVVKSDLAALIQLDTCSVGGERENLLRLRLAQSDIGYVMESSQDKIEAFALSCQQRAQRHIGPITAPHRDVSLAMILALAEKESRELRIDVPEEQSELHEILPDLGFRLIANPPAMLRSDPVANVHSYPERRRDYWAITSQAYG
ncbi:GNAT family N-acetyltransferase [Kiloniella antarctica]|uniref:GNAT family N-acetyltransferase n=1 Tax=Kiloniella antarctica TaxID=1550907 RepID=A0ABW5BGC8_9PROT